MLFAIETAASFSIGFEPGKPMQMGQISVFGSVPDVEHEQNSFD
jgi:hypothetical protein